MASKIECIMGDAMDGFPGVLGAFSLEANGLDNGKIRKRIKMLMIYKLRTPPDAHLLEAL
jgi:hypothetical protein